MVNPRRKSEWVVVRTVQGRTHQLNLNPDALAEAIEWLDRQRAMWEHMFDAVDDLLTERGEHG